MDEKYHNEKRLLLKIEKDKFSDILFNYYYLNSFGVITKLHERIGYDCIHFEYPKIIILFKRNGKFEKYVAFPHPEDHKLINKKYVHLSANYNGRLAKDKLDKYINENISDGLDHIRMLYANEPQFNENENNRASQPYQRLFYTPELSKPDKINSN